MFWEVDNMEDINKEELTEEERKSLITITKESVVYLGTDGKVIKKEPIIKKEVQTEDIILKK